MYNKDYYKQNKEKFLEWQRVYRQKNKDKVKMKRKEYDLKRKDIINQKKREWRKLHPESYKEYNRREEVKIKQRERIALKRKLTNRKYDKEYYRKNIEKIKEKQKIHAQLPEVKARRRLMERLRNKANPRSNRSLPLDLQFAMNQVRIRDGNKCMWQGCVVTHKEGTIHVHHIFPRSEYPELESVERYMICYCSIHHRHFHRMRGDSYSEMIKVDEFNPFDMVSGGD